MTTSRSQYLAFGSVAVAFSCSALFYPQLPARMATHWDAAGRANGFSSRAYGALVIPVMMLLLELLLAAVPRISPKGYRLEGSVRAVAAISSLVLLFLLFAHVLMLWTASGHALNLTRAVHFGMGALLLGIGNLFGKTTKNFFVGIRTPWTLASDEVWLRTHRLGGKLFVAAGAVSMLAAWFGSGAYVLPVAVGVAALVSVAYSYWLYRKLEGFAAPPADHDHDHDASKSD